MDNMLKGYLNSAGVGLIRGLEGIAQDKFRDRQRKQDVGTLNKFFPENVSNLILSLPERDRWSAIQMLAPEFASQVTPTSDVELARFAQPSELYPQGMGQLESVLNSAQVAPAAASAEQNQSQLSISPQTQAALQQVSLPKEELQRPSERQLFSQAFRKPSFGARLSEKQQQDITKKVESAEEIIDIANQLEKLHKTGKVASGWRGAWKSKLGRSVLPFNDETDEFDSLASRAALLEAQLIPGVTTNEKLRAAERTKPNISQTTKTQLARIRAMREKAEKTLKKYSGYTNTNQQMNSIENELGPASQNQGQIFTDGTNNYISQNNNGNWSWVIIPSVGGNE